jgi:4-amino-4-deoxy-L-arabinose transferase-like glycosyltransferase
MQSPASGALHVPSPGTLRRLLAEQGWLVLSIIVLAWSVSELGSLAVNHNTGPELYGVLTAALSVAAGVANVVLLRSPRKRIVMTAAVLVLWAVVAVGGFAGMIAHIVGPVPGHGPMDLRPRPIAAPLLFTLLGSVGALALFRGQRSRSRRFLESE